MIPITVEEALARLADNDPMEIWIERVPNNGFTNVQKESKAFCIERLKKNQPFESGIAGQSDDMGIHIVTIASPTGKAEDLCLCMIFFQTKPRCRLNEQQLAESLKAGKGSSLFSTPRPHEN